MREIKFRAWHKKLKWAWNVGIDNNGLALVQWNGGSQEDMSESGLKEWSLDQFTGLYDKKGKEIWEGDIVRKDCGTGKSALAKIIFINAAFKINWIGYPNEPLCSFDEQPFKWFEVIGNIYENPGLLETK